MGLGVASGPGTYSTLPSTEPEYLGPPLVDSSAVLRDVPEPDPSAGVDGEPPCVTGRWTTATEAPASRIPLDEHIWCVVEGQGDQKRIAGQLRGEEPPGLLEPNLQLLPQFLLVDGWEVRLEPEAL